MIDPKHARLYKDVPPELPARFKAFCETYPYQTLNIQGLSWRYIDTQSGSRVLFIPAGGTSVAVVSWQTIAFLAQYYRVISFDYPPLMKLQDLFDGVLSLFEHLQINTVDVLAGSGGTIFIQAFFQVYPQKIAKMILSTAIPPASETEKGKSRLPGWLYWMPTWLIRSLMLLSFKRLGGKGEMPPETRFTLALAKEIMLYQHKRSNFISLFTLFSQMADSFQDAPLQQENREKKTLLIFGAQDPSTPEPVRARMLTLYPEAEIKIFRDGGHAIALTHRQEYLAAITEFLA